MGRARASLAVIGLLALFSSSACGESDPGASSSSDSAPLETVACGSSDAGTTEPCCPKAWAGGMSCTPGTDSSTCWTACVSAGTRSTLSCGSDGVIRAGHGLFPCMQND